MNVERTNEDYLWVVLYDQEGDKTSMHREYDFMERNAGESAGTSLDFCASFPRLIPCSQASTTRSHARPRLCVCSFV